MFIPAIYLLYLLAFLCSIEAVDQLTEDYDIPWRKIETTAANCAVSDAQRIQCGATGIIQIQCEGKGCCWLPGTGTWCFYPGPSLSPTVAGPTIKPSHTPKPSTSQPSISMAPTPSHTNSTSNSPLSTAAVAGVVVAGVAILASIFLCYVFFKLYKEPEEEEPVEEPKKEAEEKIEIQLTPYSGSQRTLSAKASSYKGDRNLYSFYSVGNQSQISQYEVRHPGQGIEVNEFFPEDDFDAVGYEEPVLPGATSQWYEGHDRSFITP